jgi:heme-degrading monooxygenase HmoA
MKPHILVRHKVEDFDSWKQGFDASADLRRSHGAEKGHLFRSADNPDEVFILFHWDDMDRAKAFTQSAELREAMEKSGVTDQPDVFFLDEVEHF